MGWWIDSWDGLIQVFWGSLRRKLVLLILPLFLILIAISAFSYFQAKSRITEDRTVLYVEQIARDIADIIQLTILENEEEVRAMTLFGRFREYLLDPSARRPQPLLNQLVELHEVYDLICLFNLEGRVVLTNNTNRNRMNEGELLDPGRLQKLQGQQLSTYTSDSTWLEQVREGRMGFLDWHLSPLVQALYSYHDDDVARRHSIGYAFPVMDREGRPLGGILALMNWEYIQGILDKVEEDLEQRSLPSGYAFMWGRDVNTVIGHKYRQNRSYSNPEDFDRADNYGSRLIEDHQLDELRRTVAAGATHYAYEYPAGTPKISGMARVNHEFFSWVCGVGINEEDIFAPVQDLKNIILWFVTVGTLLAALLTFSIARRIAVPLKQLTRSARVVADGDFNQRVEVSGQDEVGHLARTFNEMAESLQDRSQALLELNRRLEDKVHERTQELRESGEEVRQAYQELKDTQVQLVQSEKMASLGQLVAGIAHEIKNPLNFIYGNTTFLRQYVQNLRGMIEFYEQAPDLQEGTRKQAEAFQDETNYGFVSEDLDRLIENFEEGAERIHAIIGDLRAFSRMDVDQTSTVDIHEPLNLALNLLRNEYRDRIRLHKEYGKLPEVECHPGRMSQVFMNLLSNACQAIREEGDIWIRTHDQNGNVVIVIEDNGEGIDRQHLSKVFEPFFTTKPVGQGTGLGLSISYGIVQQHKGTIEVESEKQLGTSFRVELPVRL